MITSFRNSLVKEIRLLQKMNKRKETGLTVLEGPRTLRHAFENNWEVSDVLFVASKIAKEDMELIAKCRSLGARVEEITPEILETISNREGPLGIIAAIKWKERYTLETLSLPENPLILVAESLEKPGNLGVLIRSLSAAGGNAVILCNPRTHFHNPSCIHSSLGAVFSIPCVTTTTEACIEWMKKKGITQIITTPEGKTSYTDIDMRKPCAIVMGNEHTGVSDSFIKNGITARINMHGPMDSLNVSVAGALFLFEAVRQRQEKLEK